MVYLDSSIRMLPCGSYLVLDFDWIVEEPEVGDGRQCVRVVANVCGMNVRDLHFDQDRQCVYGISEID